MQLTGPKKLVSNCSRTRVCVLGEAASSSTVPTSAVALHQHPSRRQQTIHDETNLHSSNKAKYPASQTPPPPPQQQPDIVPSHCIPSPQISPCTSHSPQTASQPINQSNQKKIKSSKQTTGGPHTSHPTPPPYTSPSTPPSHTPAKTPCTHPPAARSPLPLPPLHDRAACRLDIAGSDRRSRCRRGRGIGALWRCRWGRCRR